MCEPPPNLTEIEGDLLQITEGAIVQQCNCLTRRGHGLSAAIAGRFPYADPYKGRSGRGNLTDDPSRPGSVLFMPPDAKGPLVICLMAQWEMGRPGRYKRTPCPDGPDTRENRARWFKECLDSLGRTDELTVVYFPHTIGCGLAGGHWPTYRAMIAEYARANPRVQVVITRLPGARE